MSMMLEHSRTTFEIKWIASVKKKDESRVEIKENSVDIFPEEVADELLRNKTQIASL